MDGSGAQNTAEADGRAEGRKEGRKKNVNTGQELSCIAPVLHCENGFREQEEHLFGNWLCLSPNAEQEKEGG